MPFSPLLRCVDNHYINTSRRAARHDFAHALGRGLAEAASNSLHQQHEGREAPLPRSAPDASGFIVLPAPPQRPQKQRKNTRPAKATPALRAPYFHFRLRFAFRHGLIILRRRRLRAVYHVTQPAAC